MRTLTILCLYFILTFSISAQTRWYVDSAATGNASGLSWVDAFPDLQQALTASQANDDIWIAKGTYYPSRDRFGNVPSLDYDKTFMVKDYVSIYGGFKSGDTLLQQRELKQNKVILSGKLPSGKRVRNLMRVRYLHFYDVFDGLVLQYGMDTVNYAGGLTIQDPSGGFLKNMIIKDNIGVKGGGININDGVRMINCHFENNYARESGGGLYAGTSIPMNYLINCRFQNNQSEEKGGGLFIKDKYFQNFGNEGVIMVNCLITENAAGDLGDGIALNNMGKCYFYNTTIAGNSTLPSSSDPTQNASAIYYIDNNLFKYYNCLIEGEINLPPSGSRGSSHFYHSYLNHGPGTTPYYNINPAVWDKGGNVDTLAYLNYKDYSLRFCSPLIDTAENNFLPYDIFDLDMDGDSTEFIPLDVYGQPRYQGQLDIGAVEGVRPDTVFFSLCANDSLNVYDTVFHTSGTHYYVLEQSGLVCDSLIAYTVSPAIDTTLHTDSKGQSLYAADSSVTTFQWYNCVTDSILPNDTNQRFTPTVVGTYAVILTKNGCTDTSACVKVNQVSLAERSGEINFQIYPNPSQGLYYLHLPSHLKNVTYHLNDMQGRQLQTGVLSPGEPLDFRRHAAGVYLLQIVGEGKRGNTVVCKVE